MPITRIALEVTPNIIVYDGDNPLRLVLLPQLFHCRAVSS